MVCLIDLTVDVIDAAGEGLHMTHELRKISVYKYLELRIEMVHYLKSAT
jgi:hypothetical protein